MPEQEVGQNSLINLIFHLFSLEKNRVFKNLEQGQLQHEVVGSNAPSLAA